MRATGTVPAMRTRPAPTVAVVVLGAAALAAAMAPVAPAASAPGSAAAPASEPTRGRPADCGLTRSGTYRMHAGPRTSCRFARATYEAFVRDLEAGRELVSGTPARYAIRVRNPSTRRIVPLRVRALPRAHGEFDFTFERRSAGKSVGFENVTLP